MSPPRTAAASDFIARRLARIAWPRPPAPPPSPRAWLVETCRAELEWAGAEWRWLAGDPEHRGGGPHPSEAWRLPHERAAARVVNCHLHLDVTEWYWRELMPRLHGQRAAALDDALPETHRLYWAKAATGTEADLRDCRARRKVAWHCFLVAASDYRRLRESVDRSVAQRTKQSIGPVAA